MVINAVSGWPHALDEMKFFIGAQEKVSQRVAACRIHVLHACILAGSH